MWATAPPTEPEAPVTTAPWLKRAGPKRPAIVNQIFFTAGQTPALTPDQPAGAPDTQTHPDVQKQEYFGPSKHFGAAKFTTGGRVFFLENGKQACKRRRPLIDYNVSCSSEQKKA